MSIQEYKVVTNDSAGLFFFRHNGYSALYHAKRYMANMSHKKPILYHINERPYGARWLEVTQ